MKKHYNLFIFIFIIFFMFLPSVNASYSYIGTITDQDGARIRSGPGTNYSSVAIISYNKTVTLVNTVKHNVGDVNCPSGWFQLNYNSKTNRYICSDLIKISKQEDVKTNYESITSTPTLSSNKKYYVTDNWYARINENYATVRKTASFNANVLDTIYLGTEVKILSGPTSSTNNCSSGWYKVSYYNNKTGYVCAKLVDFYEDITKNDAEYAKILKDAGFPDSYIPYLTYLHEKHPNWTFIPDITNKYFNTAVNNETGKNYIQTNYSVYRNSNTIKENPNWYAASSSVVAFYLDPRNYLNEKNIFAFEALSYDEKNHTRNILESILEETYLAKNNDNIDYIKYFMEAAKSYNISPVHLTTRVKQEGGTNESYDAISGTSTLTYKGKSLKGYYNYYNIGAWQDDYTDSAVARGLATAAGLVGNYDGTPWDTREKAIKYGAKFIAGDYISQGQDTLYFQKFNTKNGASYASYTHQYMTNIIAPASESLSAYYAYDEINMLDTAWTFYIPVYKSMPNSPTAHPPIGDTNNDLSDLKINNETIAGFDSDVLSYTTYIKHDVQSINISATTSSTKANTKGTGDITITENETIVNVIVTSETGIDKTYTITLIKEDIKEEIIPEIKVEDIINEIDVKADDKYLTGLEEGTTVTTLSNMIKKQEAEAEVKITDSKNVNKTNTLATGDIITIKTKTDEKSYIIVIKGDTNGDGKITAVDMLRVQKHILKYSTLTNAYKEASDTNNDGKITAVDMLRIQKHILKYIKLK